MEETNVVAEEQSSPSPEKAEVVSRDEYLALQAQVEKLVSTNDRLLSESKTYKGKYQELRGNLEAREEEELKKKESWQELLEREKTRSHELTTSLSEIKRNALAKELNFQVAKHAGDAEDVDLVIAALREDALSIDSEKFRVDGVASEVDRIRKEKPFLFKRSVPAMQTKMPHNVAPTSAQKKISEMSASEKKAALMGAFAQMQKN